MEFTVMTFNLRYHEKKDGTNAWPYRINKVAEIIQRLDPLIIGTQEGLYPMLKDLEPHLSHYAWIGEGRHGGKEGEHNAIFYQVEKLEVVENGQFWLSEQPFVPASKSWETHCSRICTWVHFKSKEHPQVEWLLYNTHLDHGSQLARENGITFISEMIGQHRQTKQLPIVLSGDMNSYPSNPVIQFLRGNQTTTNTTFMLVDTFSAFRGHIGRTAHEFNGGANGDPIDYIFVSPDIHVMESRVIRDQIRGGYPSDHFPVISRLRINHTMPVE